MYEQPHINLKFPTLLRLHNYVTGIYINLKVVNVNSCITVKLHAITSKQQLIISLHIHIKII